MSGVVEDRTGLDRTGQDWTDLARNAPGIGVSYEAARRGKLTSSSDLSWRVGADSEVRVAEEVLAELTGASRWTVCGASPCENGPSQTPHSGSFPARSTTASSLS